jgi:predicted ATPase
MQGCACAEPKHPCRLVVLTGGPGAGKTAVLEVVRRAFCEHVAVLPEAATVLFGGGFPRHHTEPGRRAAQEAIFRVQRAMEAIAIGEGKAAVALCDRGTLDGLAYWPGGMAAACEALGISREAELSRYQAIIHLRTPPPDRYDYSNPVRRESSAEALALDERIAAAWNGHPHRLFIASEDDFIAKIARAVAAIRAEVPPCCRAHRIAEIGEHGGKLEASRELCRP